MEHSEKNSDLNIFSKLAIILFHSDENDMEKEEKFKLIKQYILDRFVGTINFPSFGDPVLKEELEETLGVEVSEEEMEKAIIDLDEDMFECEECGWCCETDELSPDSEERICWDCSESR